MADVITRLKLESGEYDSKIRRATQGLAQLERECRNAGKSMNNITADNLKYVQSLGQMQTVSTTTRGKLGELSQAYTELRLEYKRLTDEEKKGEFGRALSSSLEQLKARITDTRQQLASVTSEIDGATRKVGGFNLGGVGNMMGALGVSPAMLTSIGAATAGFAALKGAIESNISTAMNFERSMSQLSALTGMTGKDLEQLKDYAIELGSTSTLTASQVADAFRMIGSQQPELLKSGEALMQVTKYAITLSEAAGIDLATASQTLSTSINQMGVSSDEAARFVNVLAAASQKGAGDIGWLGGALQNSAAVAKAAGVDYEELVANLEMLAQGGYDASTAGTALRGVIGSLEKQADQDLKPSVVGLTQAFENLGQKQLDIAGYQALVGRNFFAQAMQLADNAQKTRELTEAITDTNLAEDQAKTNTDNLDGSLKSLASAWEGLNLHINSSNGFLKEAVDWLKDVVTWADQAFTAAGRAQKKLAEMQGGGNGQPTKVDQQISTLRGSNYKQVAYDEEIKRYDRQIANLQQQIADTEAAMKTNVGGVAASKGFGDVLNDVKTELAAVEKMRAEYASRAEKILSPKDNATGGNKGNVTIDIDVDDDNATKTLSDLKAKIKELIKLRDDAANKGNTQLRDQYNAQIKATRAEMRQMQGADTHHTSPQEQAAKQVADALAKYEQTISLATKEMEAGNTTEADYKRQLEQAQRRLYDAYGSAYHIYADPKYKEAQDVAAAEIVRLGGEVKGATEAQKAAQQSARELEHAQKKLAEAQREMAIARENNDLRGQYAAQKKIDVAQADVARLQPQTVTYTIQADTTDVLDKLRDIDGISVDSKTFTVTAQTAEAAAKLQAMEGVKLTPKTLEVKSDTTDVLDKLRDIDGISVDSKTFTVTAQTAEAAAKLQALEGVKLTPKTLEVKSDTAVKASLTEANIEAFKAQLKSKLAGADIGSELYDNLTAQLADTTVLGNLIQTAVKNGIDIAQFNPQDLWQKVFGDNPGDFITDKTWQSIVDKINKQIVANGGKPVSFKPSTGEVKEKGENSDISNLSTMTSGISSIASGIQQLGIELPEGMNRAIGILQGITTILTSIQTISTIKFWSGGGVVHAATGLIVPGNNYSSDLVPSMINSGELILNRAQQGVVASELERNNKGGGQPTQPYTTGETIWLGVSNYLKRTGRGEIMTTRG